MKSQTISRPYRASAARRAADALAELGAVFRYAPNPPWINRLQGWLEKVRQEHQLDRLRSTRVIGVDLGDRPVRPVHMEHLGKLTALETLGLYSNPNVTDAGLVHLANLTDLEVVQLQFTGMTDAGLAYLEHLEGLRSIDMRGTKVTPAAADQFRANHPKCRVLR